MAAPRMCLILSENWTMTCGRDLPRLVRWAREAEDAGDMASLELVGGTRAAFRGPDTVADLGQALAELPA